MTSHFPFHRYYRRLIEIVFRFRHFQYYQRKVCSHCQLIPAEGSICLVCGTLVCFKASCCKRDKMSEATHVSFYCCSCFFTFYSKLTLKPRFSFALCSLFVACARMWRWHRDVFGCDVVLYYRSPW